MAGVVKSIEKRLDMLKYVCEKVESQEITGEEGLSAIMTQLSEDIEKGKRRPQVPAPPDGISIRQAAREYNVPVSTLCSWLKLNILPVILDAGYKKYVSEKKVKELADYYNQHKGRGKRTFIKKYRN